MTTKHLLQLKRRGFTLVETLVTAGILIVLAALIMPMFSKVTKRSDMIRCASNLKNLGVAAFYYAADHDGLLPGPTAGDHIGYYTLETVTNAKDLSRPSRNLLPTLVPYLNLPLPPSGNNRYYPEIVVCPAIKKRNEPNDDAKYLNTPTSAVTEGGQIIAQRPFGYAKGSDVKSAPMKIVAIVKPSQVIGLRDIVADVHDGITNFLMMDGSVMGLRAEQYEMLGSGTVRIK